MDGDDEMVVDLEPLSRRGAPDRFGKYRNLRHIGQGGMADVFLAGWRGPSGFNKLVVVKRLRDEVASDAAFRQMFLDEARLAARLNHPNVVQTYEVFEDEGAHYITMEYLEGQPLSRLVRECKKLGIQLEPPLCARIVSDMLCGLHYAHEARDYNGVPLQIVHRDVSPQNIFVTYDGQVKVVDFGIAKAELSSTKTQVGFFKGKAAYMAPEQLEGGPIDWRVDVFTTGIILWELLTGKKLMAAESTAKTLVRLLKIPIPRVSEVVADVDPLPRRHRRARARAGPRRALPDRGRDAQRSRAVPRRRSLLHPVGRDWSARRGRVPRRAGRAAARDQRPNGARIALSAERARVDREHDGRLAQHSERVAAGPRSARKHERHQREPNGELRLRHAVGPRGDAARRTAHRSPVAVGGRGSGGRRFGGDRFRSRRALPHGAGSPPDCSADGGGRAPRDGARRAASVTGRPEPRRPVTGRGFAAGARGDSFRASAAGVASSAAAVGA